MRDHLPSVGVLPLPDIANVREINTLLRVASRVQNQGQEPDKDGDSSIDLRCGYCRKFFPPVNGYIRKPGEFYCDTCVWELAENGELL